MWPYLEKGLCRYNQVKDLEIILYLEWALNLVPGILRRKRWGWGVGRGI